MNRTPKLLRIQLQSSWSAPLHGDLTPSPKEDRQTSQGGASKGFYKKRLCRRKGRRKELESRGRRKGFRGPQKDPHCGAEPGKNAEACTAWEQEPSNPELTQHPGGTARIPRSPFAVTPRLPPRPTRPASPSAAARQPQVTGQEHPHHPVPLLTFPLTTPAAAMFPARAW